MTINQFSFIYTSLTFHPLKPILVITLTSNQFYLIDLQQKKLTDWSSKYSEKLPPNFLSLKDKIMGCSFNPSSDSMIIWGANYLCLVDFSKDTTNNDELTCMICSRRQPKPKILKKPIQQQSGEGEQYEKIYTDTIDFQLVT